MVILPHHMYIKKINLHVFFQLLTLILWFQGVFDRYDQAKKAAIRWYKHIRVIKQYEDNFNLKTLAPELLDIYVEANKLLPK